MKKSQDVFESYMKAVYTLNPSKVLEDYTNDAIFITPDNTYKGREEIFCFYEAFLPKFKDFHFKTIKKETRNDVVYFVWNGKNEHIDV
ncbi:MAG: nuclear transport factor 2 family protein [Bacteroidota bacterium]